MTELREGTRVKIISGPHKGATGTLVKINRKTDGASIKIAHTETTIHLSAFDISRA